MKRAQQIVLAAVVGFCLSEVNQVDCNLALGAPAPEVEGTPAVIGRSVEGRPIHCRVFGSGEDVLMIIATIHGNEAAGTPLVEQFALWLAAHPSELEGRRVVIVPVANPDGLAADERLNARGVDLNRNFPAGNWNEPDSKPHGDAPLSEVESRLLLRLILRYFPNRIISIHQPVTCIDYDGPAEQFAAAMGAHCKLPVKRIGSRPGSLGSFFGLTLGKPIITFELPKDAGMDGKQLWQQYGPALIAALRYRVADEPALTGKTGQSADH